VSNLEMIKSELWKRGNLEWKLHDGQKKIYSLVKGAKEKLYVLNCSRQWGKSYLMAAMAIELAMQKKNARIRYGAAFHTDLSEFIIPAFEKVLDDCPDEYKPKYLSQKSKYVFRNGSEIKLVGVDKNPNGLRGNTLDWIVLDECGFIGTLDYVYKSVIIPSTTHRRNARILMISTPPSSPAHDFVTYCRKAMKEGNYSKFTIYDNPMLSKADIDKLAEEVGGYESVEFKREYLCEFVVDSKLAIIPEWLPLFARPADTASKLYPLWHKYVGLDIGVVDKTVALFGHYNFQEARLYVQAEFDIQGDKVLTEDIASKTLKLENALWGTQKPYRRIADNNNLVLINDLSTLHNINFVPTTKEALEAMVNEVRMWVKAGRIHVDPQCSQLLGCLEFGVWNKRRDKFDRSTDFGHFDALAALVYLVRNIDCTTNPVPYDFGYEKKDIFYNEPPKLSNSGKALKSVFSVKGKL